MFATVADQRHSSTHLILEHVSCPLCVAERHEPVLSARDPAASFDLEFQIVRCVRCGLHYTNPRPTPESIGQFYTTNYRPHTGKAHHDRPLRAWYPQDWLQAPASKSHRPRLLDFGCGAGHFLAGMDRQGWEAIGLDLSAMAVETIREKIGLAAFTGSLPHEELEPASFHLVTMWHSLEHVHHPKRILREARRLLRPDGRMIVAVPNFDGWPRRWFGDCWFGLDLPRHLTHFGPDTLTRMLEETGFRLLGLRHARHADWLRSSARLAQCRGQVSLCASMLRYRPLARIASRSCQRARRSDAMLALAEPT